MSFSWRDIFPPNCYICDYMYLFVNIQELSSKSKFNRHVETIAHKCKSFLGIMKRWCEEFDNPYIANQLYMAWTMLEYASVILAPRFMCHIDAIESVRGIYLCALWVMWSMQLINIPTLENAREFLFLYGYLWLN